MFSPSQDPEDFHLPANSNSEILLETILFVTKKFVFELLFEKKILNKVDQILKSSNLHNVKGNIKFLERRFDF